MNWRYIKIGMGVALWPLVIALMADYRIDGILIFIVSAIAVSSSLIIGGAAGFNDGKQCLAAERQAKEGKWGRDETV